MAWLAIGQRLPLFRQNLVQMRYREGEDSPLVVSLRDLALKLRTRLRFPGLRLLVRQGVLPLRGWLRYANGGKHFPIMEIRPQSLLSAQLIRIDSLHRPHLTRTRPVLRDRIERIEVDMRTMEECMQSIRV